MANNGGNAGGDRGPLFETLLTSFGYRRFVEHVLTGQPGSPSVREAIEHSRVLRGGAVAIAHAIGRGKSDRFIDRLAEKTLGRYRRDQARLARMRTLASHLRAGLRGLREGTRRVREGWQASRHSGGWTLGEGILIVCCLIIAWQFRGAFGMTTACSQASPAAPEIMAEATRAVATAQTPLADSLEAVPQGEENHGGSFEWSALGEMLSRTASVVPRDGTTAGGTRVQSAAHRGGWQRIGNLFPTEPGSPGSPGTSSPIASEAARPTKRSD